MLERTHLFAATRGHEGVVAEHCSASTLRCSVTADGSSQFVLINAGAMARYWLHNMSSGRPPSLADVRSVFETMDIAVGLLLPSAVPKYISQIHCSGAIAS